MMDSKQNVGSPDRDRINVNEDYELQYWSEKFNISRDELKEAVKAAGTSVKDVQAYLNK
ncbi:DUF3606 domain-containing protein [Mucilaginibacter sp. 14171R-50]|nr:DUF3606 domain-containing protein [Mucilaginibacter sp. 14171R-50]